MPKLNPNKQLHLNQSVLKKILQSYGLRLSSFFPFQTGIENTSALVHTNQGKFVLRVYRKQKKSVKDITQELQFMNFLKNENIPVPEIQKNVLNKTLTLFKQGNITWKCILMECMPGKHPQRYSSELITDLAMTHAQLHVLGKKFARTQKTQNAPLKILKDSISLKKAFQKHTILDPKVRDIIKRAREFRLSLSPALPHAYNHLDIIHDNILAHKNKLSAILDFDDLAYAPMVVCLGYTLFDILSLTKDVKKILEYISVYNRTRKLQAKEISILKDIILFRNYADCMLEILFFGEKGKDVPKCIKLEQIILRLDRKTLIQATLK